MNRVFGKKKKAAPAPSLGDTSSSLGGRVEEMDKKIMGLEKELKVFKDKIKNAKSPAAKKMLQKRAMEVLKRKKMYEQQRDMVAGQQFNIDQASFGIESAQANVQTIAAMKVRKTFIIILFLCIIMVRDNVFSQNSHTYIDYLSQNYHHQLYDYRLLVHHSKRHLRTIWTLMMSKTYKMTWQRCLKILMKSMKLLDGTLQHQRI